MSGLGEVVRKTSGLLLTEFAEQYLFTPLGISNYRWVRLPNANEVNFASSGLYIRPRDMAKIGQLYLQEGVWNGDRIISTEWVRESIRESIHLTAESNPIPSFAYGYGYQWWLGTYNPGNINAYLAGGRGDQFIIIFPDLDMVVVTTGGAYLEDSPFVVYDVIINEYILPAVL